MNTKKNIRKTIAVTSCLLALASAAGGGQLQITHPTTGDTPPAGGTPPANLYVAISKYNAANSGVNFAATETTQNGQVTSWLWNFTNGSPSTSSQQNPGVVTFSGSAAYGNSNACTVNVAHTSTDQNGQPILCTPLTGLPVATVNVNVVKPKLVFNTSGTWSSNDSACRRAQVDAGEILTIGQGTYYNYGPFDQEFYGAPYEYIFTIDSPNNSGASSSDMAIYESGQLTYAYYSNNNLIASASPSSATTTIYNMSGSGYCSSPNVDAPANPTMYAFDMPGVWAFKVYSNMYYYGCNTSVMYFVLTSYPLFQDAQGQHLDSSAKVTHTFQLTCTSAASNGQGPYTWVAHW